MPHRSQFLMCDGCGATVEIPGDELADQLSHSAPANGFEVHRQVIELSGDKPAVGVAGPERVRLR